ncbi:MAG: hypothetical protein IGS39_25310 [Calothrix sp. C42_A2020_038]|nr:hypothetical protein [Calothrix sp. C42_A2020_038]
MALVSNHKFLSSNPVIRNIACLTGLKRPSSPRYVGMKFFRENSTWELDVKRCPCDLEFIDYIKDLGIEGKNIFHFGTGVHHIVGLENQKLDVPNEIIGITAAVPEHQAYVKLVLKNPDLAKYYKVIFADIYTLTANTLPRFDIINLFHLCEFYLPENSKITHHNDASLLQIFIDKLNPDGKIIFYSGSSAWGATKSLIKSLEETGQIKQVHEYKSLVVYTKA